MYSKMIRNKLFSVQLLVPLCLYFNSLRDLTAQLKPSRLQEVRVLVILMDLIKYSQ